MKSRRRVTLAVLSFLFAVVAGSTLPLTSIAGAQGAVPYQDPNAVGFIGLCDKAGNPIDHGSVNDQPFVWSAQASSPAPSDYAGDGRTATLFAYQPRPNREPGEWSGSMLNASSRYTNPAHPMSQSTDRDLPLTQFLSTFPPQLDGLVQLRIFVSAPGKPPYTEKYAATDIRISGDSWSVVRGGTVPCNAGSATSIEDIYQIPTSSTTAAPAPAPPTTAPPTSAPAGASGSEAGAPGQDLAAASTGTSVPTPGTTAGTGTESSAGTVLTANAVARGADSNPNSGLGKAFVAVIALAAVVGLVLAFTNIRSRNKAQP